MISGVNGKSFTTAHCAMKSEMFPGQRVTGSKGPIFS